MASSSGGQAANVIGYYREIVVELMIATV